jgi:hypothetical protein
MNSAAERLPHIDEHSMEIRAAPEATWAALEHVVEASVSSGAAPHFARLLGCADIDAAGPRPLAEGSAVPGFHVAAALAPSELALAGSHRFSRYALVFRLDDLGPGRTRLRAETRAEFPGLRGSAYRALVIGTRGHILATRRLLGATKRRAEHS